MFFCVRLHSLSYSAQKKPRILVILSTGSGRATLQARETNDRKGKKMLCLGQILDECNIVKTC